MKLYRSIPSLPSEISRAVTIGNFDGVHQGHQAIIHRLLERAAERGETPLVVTFRNHTAAVVRHNWPPLLMSVEERLEALHRMGVPEILLLEFTEELSRMTAETFLTSFQEKGARSFVVGHDFRCGLDRGGDTKFLMDFAARHGLRAEVVAAIRYNREIVSSTRIRNLLTEGDIEEANRLLGRPFTLEGLVTHGEKRGRTLGFPTANLQTEAHRLVPRFGVYRVRTLIDGVEEHYGVANVGVKPTFMECPPLIEVYLLDFSRDIYGKHLTVEFLSFIRPEKRFGSAEELVAQMRMDVEKARGIEAEKQRPDLRHEA